MPDISNHPFKTFPADTNEGPGHWFACDHPERPATRLTLFMSNCDTCLLALTAALKIPGSGWFEHHEDVGKLLNHSEESGLPVIIGRKAA